MPASRRLHIAYVVDTWDGVKTGGVISAKRFIASMRERHDVTVVAGGPSSEGRLGLPQFTVPPFGRVMREMGFIFAWPKRSVLEPLLQQVDVVHIQFPFWLGIRTGQLARQLGTPVVAASHIQPENIWHNIGLHSEWLVDKTWRFFISVLYGKADHLVVPTAFGLAELRKRGLSNPADVVSNGIPPQFHPGPAEREARYQGRFVVLAVSRLAAEKRIDVVIEAVRRCRQAANIQLIICGHGPEEEKLRALAATLPLPAEFRVVEEVDMPGVMRRADLLVHASQIELEGMAVLEGLGIGLPTLVADSPLSAAAKLAVTDEFRFPPGNCEELARRIDLLVEQPARLAAARKAALQAAAGLTLEASVSKMEEIYMKVARPQRATGPAALAAGATATPAAR